MPHDDLLDLALDAARRAGADAADVLLVERDTLGVSVRLGDLETLERKEAAELSLRVLVGRRPAVAATNRLDRDEIAALAAELVASARLLPEDSWCGLADAAQLAGRGPELDLIDAAEPSPEGLIAAARSCEAAARGIEGVSNSEGGDAGWSRSRSSLRASNGFSGSYARTRWSLGASVLAGSGTGMESDGEWRQATHGADLPPPEAIGRIAGLRAVRRLGPRKAESRRVSVVYAPRAARSLLYHLSGAIGGEAVAAGRSFLKDRLGQMVCAPGVTITDDPHRRRGLGSRPFDGEGLATSSRAIVEAGRLTTFLLDLGTARRLGAASTGHASRGLGGLGSPGPSNLVMEPGERSPEDLMADIKAGFYVTDLLGSGVNRLTGDYSRGAAGFWIENGEVTYPVGEVTIAGNLGDMLARMLPANDLEIRGTADAPTVRIDDLMVAGR